MGRKRDVLYAGQEVWTDCGIQGFVQCFWSKDNVEVRYNERYWPFPLVVSKSIEQLSTKPPAIDWNSIPDALI